MDASISESLESQNLRRLPERRPRPADLGETAAIPETYRPIETVREPEVGRTATIAEPEIVPRDRSERLSRTVNLVLASVALVILSPLFLLIALAIRLTSRGPVLYMQPRVGLDRRWHKTYAMHNRRVQDLGGTIFKIYKFRSMYVDAEGKSGAVWATPGDKRVTPVGRFLRQFRLDELPQLINVLRGDMSLVGPRPLLVEYLPRYSPEQARRHEVKPGITGLAQVEGRNGLTWPEKFKLDVYYVDHQSLALDLKILARTVAAVIRREGIRTAGDTPMPYFQGEQ